MILNSASSTTQCPSQAKGLSYCDVCFFQEPLILAEDDEELLLFDIGKKRRIRKWTEGRKLGASLQYGERRCEEAELRSCIFPRFNFMKELAYGNSTVHEKTAGNTMVWDDGHARFAKDQKGFPIVAHFPDFLRNNALEEFTQLCLQTGRDLKLSIGGGADKNGRNHSDSFKFNAGEVVGSKQFSHCQHAIGKPNVKPLPSKSVLNTCTNHDVICDFMKDSSFLSERLNGILKGIDSDFYEGIVKVRKVINGITSVSSFTGFDPILMEGRSLIFNRQTRMHKDKLDVPTGWQFIIAAGDFKEGGALYLPHLDLRLRLLPGDLVALRGRVLSHEIESWSGGQRISMVNFSHESVWNYAKVPIPHLSK